MYEKLTQRAQRVLYLGKEEAKAMGHPAVGTEHLLLSILRDEDNIASQILQQFRINYEVFKAEVEQKDPQITDQTRSPGDDEYRGEEAYGQPKKVSDIKSKTPVLDNFGRDLTRAAEEGRLDPIVGREKEIERVSQILSRRKKNNPILIGEPGVGKSAIAEG